MGTPSGKLLQVGEVARRTGLTVRTLHHWEEVGLLQPARRTGAGYRLYGEAELRRALAILSLRQLGLSLAEIADALGEADLDLEDVLRRRIRALDREMEEHRRLRRRLVGLLQRSDGDDGIDPDELTEAMEAMTMFEKYYTEEQLERLAARKRELGPERIAAVEAEWPKLIAAMTEHMRRGTDPSDPEVRKLARRWQELVREFTGGDEDIARSLANLYRGEGEVRERTGIDSELMEYVGRAAATGRES